jgi:hypothetical protein
MAKTRCGRIRLGRSGFRTWPALLLVAAGLGLAGCGGGHSGNSLSTSPTVAPPSASDLATVRSAASRTMGTRVSASIVLVPTAVFGVSQPDVTGAGTFDLAAAKAQVEVRQPTGMETVLFFPSLVYVRQPASSAGAALPPGKVWISTDLVQQETVSTNFSQFVLQVEDLNPAVVLGEVAGGAISAAPLGSQTIAGSRAQGYLVTVDLATAAARTSGPGAKALARTMQDELSASGRTPGTAAPPAEVRVWISSTGQVVQVQASPAGSGVGTTLLKLSPYRPQIVLTAPSLAQVVDIASLTPLGERENNGRGDADGA